MKRNFSIYIALVILIFIIVGYDIKSPRKNVENYFQNIKSGTSSSNTLSLFSSINDVNNNSDTKKITNSLINSLSKLEIKILDESIDGDKATVNVQAKGLSLYTTLNKVYTILKSEEYLEKINDMKEDELENYFTSLLVDAINNSEIEERTITLNLTKVNKTWQIDDIDEVIIEVLWGISEENRIETGI